MRMERRRVSSAGEIGASEAYRRQAPSGAARVIVGLGALFVVYLFSIWTSEILSQRPAAALVLNPHNATALIIRAGEALDQDPPDLDMARSYANRALRADPLAPGIHRMMARVAEEEGATSRHAASRLAARYARDGQSQVAVLQSALAAGDYEEAVHRLDLLFRGQGQGQWGRIAQAFDSAILDPAFAASLAKELADNPPWRRVFLDRAFSHAPSVSALIVLYGLLPAPQAAETRVFLQRLVHEKRHDVAHAVFVNQLPEDRLNDVGLLYNARFQFGVSNLPFDWVITPMPNTLTEVRRDRNRRTLRVSFFGGRTPYRNVNHLMALTPGSYIFSGTAQALSLSNPRGMRWQIACADRLNAPIAMTELLAGDVPARPFSVAFTVGANCSFQNLQLELAFRVALEQEATGSVVYSDLSVAPTQQ